MHRCFSAGGGLAAGLLLALAISSSAAAGPDEEAIAKIEHDFAEMQITKDPATIARVASAMDEGFRFTDPASPDAGVTKAQLLQMIDKGKLEIQSMAFRPFTVRVFGATAVAEGVNTGRATFEGADVGGTFAWVDVFEKRDGRWIWVFSQSGKVGDRLAEKQPCGRAPCPTPQPGFSVQR